MLNSSLRRVRICPKATLPLGRPTSIAATFTSHSHQRRNSSSKPPIPPHNGIPIPASQVKQVGIRTTKHRPNAAESKKKIAKGDKVEIASKKEDYSNEWTRSLPSVPSTQHLNPKDVYVASFFSTHRPISITGPLPPETSSGDIEKIFQIRPKSQRKTQDVIYTLSSAIQNLEGQTADQQQQAAAQHEEGVSGKADLIKALTQHNNHATQTGDPSTHHLDGQPQNAAGLRVGGNVKLVIQALARQFRPFNPPPAPVAAPEVEFYPSEQQESQAASSTAEAIPELEDAQAEALEQQIAAQDAQSLEASSKTNDFFTPSFHNSSRRTHRGLLLARHIPLLKRIRLERIKGGLREMLLISVKRQRKLKMKKHKLKKLRTKTRNLRRRQGKI